MNAACKLSATLSGIAGEYFVAGELSRRGYIASITLRNTRGIDLLVSNADATKSVAIQVKTNQRTDHKSVWVLNWNKRISEDVATNLFFVFVRLNHPDGPQYHVVPRAEVHKAVCAEHANWMQTPGRKGQPHNESSVRNFRDPDGKYLNRWDLLGL